MDMQVDMPAISPSNAPQKSVENVIHLLTLELMNAVKVIDERPELPANARNVSPIQSESLLVDRMQSGFPIRSNDMVDSTYHHPSMSTINIDIFAL
jgi:hypothetical protein